MKQDDALALAAVAGLVIAGVAVALRRRSSPEPKCAEIADTSSVFAGVELEDYPPWAPVAICDPTPKPGAVAFRDWVLRTMGGRDVGISRACEGVPTSRHHEGRAWDWGQPDHETAELFLRCLLAADAQGNAHALARRAGLRVIIYNRRIWTSGTKEWRPYTGASPHTDHVHFAFGWPGARGETSLYAALGGAMDELGAVELAADDRVFEMWGVRGIEHTSPAFRRKVVRLARALELDPNALMAVMSFETAGTFNPRITPGGKDFAQNPNAAVGLIQFSRQWAPVVVGKTTAELAGMSALEQLDYVRAWYEHGGTNKRVQSTVDHYFAVFSPSCLGAPLDRVVYPKGSKAAAANSAMDVDGDGAISCGEVSVKFAAFARSQEARPRVLVNIEGADMDAVKVGVGVSLVFSALGFVLGWT